MSVEPDTQLQAAPAPGTPKVVRCPACGAGITLRALGQSVMAACPSCRTQIDVSQPEIRVIQKYREEAQRLHIPLGTRGTLRGQLFEVIGAMQRLDSGYEWEEYLLFNPYQGFRWLVYDHGHWNFGRAIRDTSWIRVDLEAHYRGHRFRKFHQGPAVVDWVIGEFHWRVAYRERAETTDYIAPPLMLSREKSGTEITWTLLEYLEPSEVEAAFRIKCPERESVAANQPNPRARALRSIVPVMLIALAAAFVIQFGTALSARNQSIYVGTYQFPRAPGDEEQVYGPFTLPATHSLNELIANAGLENSWVELNCSLVNTQTGESFDFTNAFEHYSGVDSDGSWSEGSYTGTSLLRGIPAGTYNLVVDGSGAGPGQQPLSRPVSLSLRHDLAPWRNFWLAVAAILLYPAWLLYRRHGFERQR